MYTIFINELFNYVFNYCDISVCKGNMENAIGSVMCSMNDVCRNCHNQLNLLPIEWSDMYIQKHAKYNTLLKRKVIIKEIDRKHLRMHDNGNGEVEEFRIYLQQRDNFA